jgi:hypothetical protein
MSGLVYFITPSPNFYKLSVLEMYEQNGMVTDPSLQENKVSSPKDWERP